jgi:serine/threonine protein kinase
MRHQELILIDENS